MVSHCIILYKDEKFLMRMDILSKQIYIEGFQGKSVIKII